MKQELLDALKPFGQEHLLAFWEELSSTQQEKLAEQVRDIDFQQLAKLYDNRDKAENVEALVEQASPPPAFRLDKSANRFSVEEAKARAAEALAEGKIGVILVAGGQGTRLGFEHPKGMYQIGPVSNATLFQIHIEKIRALAKQYGRPVPLYVMTSPATHAETVEFFEQNDRFGLPVEDLIVFCQGTMPAVDMASGKVLLADKDQLALSPDGHGGMLAALKKSGALANALDRGVEQLFYFQVDNPLVDIGGEEFIGYHLLSDSELSTQVVAKQNPLDRVGNVVQVDGRLHIIEYSDLPDAAAELRAEDGSTRNLGREYCRPRDGCRVSGSHGRQVPTACRSTSPGKKWPYIDNVGETVKSEEPNAIKFERFIFDLLPSAERAIVVEIDPKEGLCPVEKRLGRRQ